MKFKRATSNTVTVEMDAEEVAAMELAAVSLKIQIDSKTQELIGTLKHFHKDSIIVKVEEDKLKALKLAHTTLMSIIEA